jgi:CRP-like cAMP-binding protein
MKENDIVYSVPSFYRQCPSIESIQTIERTEVCYISYAQFEHLFIQFDEFKTIFRRIMEQYHTRSELRNHSLRMPLTKDRLSHMMHHYPDIVERVPDKLLASYLGSTAVNLSRIKRNIL